MATPAARAWQDGDTREIRGVPHVRRGGRWFPVTAGPGAGPTLTPLGPPDPRVASEVAQAPIELERERVGLERDRVALEAARADREREAQGRAAQEGERRAAFLATRVAGGIADIEDALRDDPGAQRPTVSASIAGLFGSEARNWMNSPARQRVEAAQLDILDAALTLGTGAAYTREQIEGYRQSYFPNITDDDTTIADKRERLLRLLESARINAGSAAPQIDAALTALRNQAGEPGGRPTAPAGGGPLADQDPNNPLNVRAGETDEEFVARQDEEARRAGLVLLRVDPDGVRRYGPPPGRGDADADRNRLLLEQTIFRAGPAGGLFAAADSLLGAEGGNAFQRGFHDIPTLGFADEIRAGIGSLGGEDFSSLLANERAVDAYDYNNNFGARLSGQLTGGFTLPMRGATLPRLMSESALYGGAYGLGSGEGAERVPSALVGAAVGAAAPAALRVIGAPVRSAFGRAATPEQQAIARAAEEEGVTISRPILDPASRTRMARLEASVGGSSPVRGSLAKTEAGIESRAGELAQGGAAGERGAMGQRIQAAANASYESQGRRIGAIYDRADEAAAGATIEGREAVAALDAHLARLRENPTSNRALIGLLEDYRSDFVDPAGNLIPKTIGAIRDLRTNLRGEINQRNLATSNAERMVSDALDAAGRDIRRDLADIRTGPEALRLYNRADRAWRSRAENRRQIVERVIGPADNPISGAAVMDRVKAMASGDTPRLRRLWRMLDPDEQRDAAATIAAAAGRRAPEDPFSPAQFMAWARTISPSAREVIFGPDGARSIANLTRLTREYGETVGALNNSRSGMVRNWGAFLSGATSGGPVGAGVAAVAGTDLVTTGGAGLALTAGAAGLRALYSRISARSLMSPDMSRWLENAAQATSEREIREHIGRLATVAARDPAIAQEATGLQQALLSAVNDNFERRAAASEPDQEQRR